MKFAQLLLLSAFLPAASLASEQLKTSINPAQLLDIKLTPQAKYLTSREAYSYLEKNPDVLFVDVRDPVEIAINGHPEMIDAVVPVRAQGTEFDEALMEWELKDNPNFVMYMDQALEHFAKSKTDMIILTCGSGWRSGQAARLLYDAGYTNVWHIPDGYEGEYKRGFNSANAWKLEGLPWSYEEVYGSGRLRIIQ